MGLVKPPRGWRTTDDEWDDVYRGLEGLWLFNDGTGGAVGDGSGKAYHGSANNLSWSANENGSLGSFNGTNTYVTAWLPSVAFAGDYSFMVMAWDDGTKSPTGLIQAANQPIESYGAISIVKSGDLWYLREHPRSQLATSITHPFTPSVWAHLCLTRQGDQLNGYLNGMAGTPATFSGIRCATSGEVRFGVRLSANVWRDYFSGLIAYIAIWSRALSQTEVGRIYQQAPWME